jgi:hypothetical protein
MTTIWNVAVAGVASGASITMPCRISSACLRCVTSIPKRLHAVSEQFSIPCATVSFGELLAMSVLDIIDI